MKLVSIIVPIYNAERFLVLSIDSVLAQSYQAFELLLLNDGSTDNSAQICDEYAKRDARIRVFHTENSGVSSARNLGLDNARGEYVMFLDADDFWCDNNFLANLVTLAENNHLDVIRGEYKAVNEQGKALLPCKTSIIHRQYSDKIIDSFTFIKEVIKGEFFLVLSLFKRSSIDNLRLNANQIFLEDMRFYSQLLMKPLRCMYTPLCFYAYRKNENSVSYQLNPKKLVDSFGMCDFFHYCAQQSTNALLSEYYNYYSVMMYKWTLETLALYYYNQKYTFIEQLELNALSKKVFEWIKRYNIECSIFPFYLQPIYAIVIYKFLNKIKGIYHYIKVR